MNYKVTPDMLELRGPDVRQAFEVEDISRRENYTFVYEPEAKSVELYNTSRGIGRRLQFIYQESGGHLFPSEEECKMDPHDCKTAYAYFQTLLNKSRTFPAAMTMCFLGWVDPDSIEPLADFLSPLDFYP
jgi:hypothetical protein